MVRQMDAKLSAQGCPPRRFAVPLALSALLALLIAIGDYQFAGSLRSAAHLYDESRTDSEGKNWFEGYWG